MVNGSPHYATANAFRRALDDRLKTQAKLRSQPVSELRREFLFQRFLALLFANPESQWVLKGGASLLMRLTEARFSRDLDLLHLGELSPTEAVEELRMLTRPRAGDHLTFVIGDGVTYSRTNPIVQIGVTAYIGAKYESFPIDLARDLHLVAIPERIQLRPVAEVPGLPELPQVVVYSLADQVADKVCAMYERYGEVQAPSSRYRDLIDLALIVSTCPLDAEPLSRALHLESLRREMQLPERMIQPGDSGTPAMRLMPAEPGSTNSSTRSTPPSRLSGGASTTSWTARATPADGYQVVDGRDDHDHWPASIASASSHLS